MATTIIQHRRGAFADFNPADIRPGEIVVIQRDDTSTRDGRAVYVCFSAGEVKRLTTQDELREYNDSAQQAAVEAAASVRGAAALEKEIATLLADAKAAAKAAKESQAAAEATGAAVKETQARSGAAIQKTLTDIAQAKISEINLAVSAAEAAIQKALAELQFRQDDGAAILAEVTAVTKETQTAAQSAKAEIDAAVADAKAELGKALADARAAAEEMPDPAAAGATMGGCCTVDATGRCYIYLSAEFIRAAAGGPYRVFLQAEGGGELYVAEKAGEYIVVRGTPGLSFSWEARI